MATCTYTVPDKNASGDNFYGAVICNQVYVDYFWNTYGFSGNKVYWDDGWGWDDCSDGSGTLQLFSQAYNDLLWAEGLLRGGGDKALAAQLEAIFERDTRDCIELKADAWARRGLWHRCKDNVFYAFNELL